MPPGTASGSKLVVNVTGPAYGLTRFSLRGGGTGIGWPSTVTSLSCQVMWSASARVRVFVAETFLPSAVRAATLLTHLPSALVHAASPVPPPE